MFGQIIGKWRMFAVFLSFELILINSAVLREIGKMNSSHRPDYIRKARAFSSNRHQVIIAIHQNNLDKATEYLYEVSTKSSYKYGQFLSYEEVGDLVVNQAATDAVISWLRSNNVNIVDVSTYGEYIRADATVSTWENLLQTEMHEYEPVQSSHQDTLKKVVRGLSYSVPEYLDSHIFAIHEFTHLPPRISYHSRLNKVRGADANDISTLSPKIFPQNLRSFYFISGNGEGFGNQAVYSAIGQTFLPSDLATFQSLYGIPNDPVDKYVGPVPLNAICHDLSSDDCDEASLDTQWMLAIGQNVSTTFWYDASSAGDFVSFASSIANTADPSYVYSISYGAYEIDIPSSSIQTFNTEAIKAGLRGITIIASAGDDGVAGSAFRPVSDGGDGLPLSQCGYYASWPASSPYVTAVGATMNGPALTNTAEIACTAPTGSIITTGGGFSNSIPAPPFQLAVIESYFKKLNNDPVQSSFQPYVTTNRGYPDIALQGNAYAVIIGGHLFSLSGTSASAPVFAGMVSLVNAYRIQTNLAAKGLGWLNPSIYENDGGFILHDIISGNNQCTASSSACCSIGFSATSGWDPVSGFGSIDFSEFFSYYTTNVPTFSPTHAPTTTAVAYKISYSVVQQFLSIVAADSFASDSSVISNFNGIVAVILVPSYPTVQVAGVTGSRYYNDTSIRYVLSINYTVSYTVTETVEGLESLIGVLSTNVTTALTNAVSSGLFNYLFERSSSSVIQYTTTFNSMSPVISNASIIEAANTVKSSSDGPKTLSESGVVAISVLLILLFAFIIGCLIYRATRRNPSQSDSSSLITMTAPRNTKGKSSLAIQGDEAFLEGEIARAPKYKSVKSKKRRLSSDRESILSARDDLVDPEEQLPPEREVTRRPSLLAQSMSQRDNPLLLVKSHAKRNEGVL